MQVSVAERAFDVMMMHKFTHLVSVPYTANLFDRTTATLERMTGIIAGSSDDMIGEGRPTVARDIRPRVACAAAIPARSQIGVPLQCVINRSRCVRPPFTLCAGALAPQGCCHHSHDRNLSKTPWFILTHLSLRT